MRSEDGLDLFDESGGREKIPRGAKISIRALKRDKENVLHYQTTGGILLFFSPKKGSSIINNI